MIWTSYFDNIKKLPSGFIPVSITPDLPEDYAGLLYSPLFPEEESVGDMKKYGESDNTFFKDCYIYKVLDKLSPDEVLQDLYKLTNGSDNIVLVTQEKTGFSHRKLVSEWLRKNNIQSEEYPF